MKDLRSLGGCLNAKQILAKLKIYLWIFILWFIALRYHIFFRKGLNKKGRTVAYGMWHSARIEDITMNLLVAEKDQVIDKGNWMKKTRSMLYGTGNDLNAEDIIKFSENIDFAALKEYRNAVGIRTREIISEMSYKDTRKE